MKTKRTKRLIIISGILIISVVTISQSFGSIIKFLYGVHSPRVENAKSLLKTARKYELDTSHIATLDSKEFPHLLKEFRNSIPEAMIFDKQGRYIEYKANDSACNAGLFSFIPALDKNTKYTPDDKRMLKDRMGMLKDIHGKALPASFLNPDADFYVLISWAAFTGRLNKDHVHAWQNLAEHNTKAKIQVIEVNFDLQQWWPKPELDAVLAMYAKKQ